ncbi:MAG: MBL fold metallo-hydrolase [Chloroflexota bacterium]
MEFRITTLSENTASWGLVGEWGLSMLVEADGLRVLMDCGFSFSAAYNARTLGVDLASLDRIVLSHGHADHTGGLDVVLKSTGRREVVGHPDIWEKKYARTQDGGERYVGMPSVREGLEALGAGFVLTREPVRLSDRVMTTGEIPVTVDYEGIEPELYVRRGAESMPDRLADDLALVIDADFGLVVVLGCAHRGIVNTLHHALRLTGGESIYAVVGGAHLFRASEERLERTVADLREMGIQKLALCHCTGFKALSRLAQEFGDGSLQNNAGTRIVLP